MTHPTSIAFELQGLSCAGCVGRAEKALRSVPGVRSASVNLATHKAQVEIEGAPAMAAARDALQTAGYPVAETEVRLEVTGLSCAACVGRLERALLARPEVISASVNLAANTATVGIARGAITAQSLAQLATDAGYPSRVQDGAAGQPDDTREDTERAEAARRFRFAALLCLPVFFLGMGSHAVPAVDHWIHVNIGMQTSWAVQWLLTTLILLGPGRAFYTWGFPALWRRAPDMNSLVALGTGAAYLFSAVAILAPDMLPAGTFAVYFEASAVIVTLILAGRHLEARAKGQTGAAIRALMELQSPTARVKRDGALVDVDVADLGVGETLIVRPGERLGADGVVAVGNSFVDESMLTGEAMPVAKGQGDAVSAGTVNKLGALEVTVTAAGADTTLSQIIRMVQSAQGAKLPIQSLIDKVTYYFVPAVLGIALLTLAVWLAFGPEPSLGLALVASVSVLIVACPCAMGLATPTSIMVGTGRAAELGVLFRKGDALQSLGQVDVVAFDKTGTLTIGQPELVDVVPTGAMLRGDVLRLAAAVEARSEHPLADAVLRGARAEAVGEVEATDVKTVVGYGVKGQVDGQVVRVGAERFMAEGGLATDHLAEALFRIQTMGRTAVLVAVGTEVQAILAVADPIKATALATVKALQARGVEVAMVTGDSEATAAAVAAELGIHHVIADVLPQEKAKAVTDLMQAGRSVAFVGDGINDAPALAEATVGIAIGTGTDVAIESADVVLMSGDPAGVANAVELSRRAMSNIRQNLAWAFVYNVALIPVSAGVLFPLTGALLSPVYAAAAMALSSVSVVSNALRLRRVTPVLASPSTGVDGGANPKVTPANAVHP